MLGIMKNEKGLTLLQMVIVIIILTMLAGIFVPKYISMASHAKRAKCLENHGALNAAASISYAESAQSGTPSYPAALAGLEDKMARYFTDECANEDGTLLIYDNTTGRVTCPNHP